MFSSKNCAKGHHKPKTPAEEQAKVKELRTVLGPLSGRSLIFCTDDCLARYLRARDWNVEKAEKMLKEALKWRASYKPEDIRWDDIRKEAATGKMYKLDLRDKVGRPVIGVRFANQTTDDMKGHIKHLVYTMENAIINFLPGQEQTVWLVDLKGWSIGKLGVFEAKDTIYIVQTMYPERLGHCFLLDPPRVFEPFFNLIKRFLEPATANKLHFVYTNRPESFNALEELLDMDKLVSEFGGNNSSTFNLLEYEDKMRQDDIKTAKYWSGPTKIDS
ncbi:hypothetical protein R1sor_018489 [Riccia sorocarpa]|uniref:CRAL-TRIO domain-containing protein n=1 Tax=Riccia sorocarpa TaxID=122646 RepID=A0ABD3IDY3_9MARC